MEEPNSSSSAPDNGPRSVPPSPPSPSIAFKFTDVKSGVSPKNTRIGANPTSLNAKNALPFERRSPPRKNTTTTIRNAPPPRPSTPPQPHQVINIPTHSTDSPSMTTQVSELSHNSSSRTPTNNATPLTPTTKRPLNSIQQAAMNNFLTAKGKDEKAKAWDELVRSLKQTHRGGGGSVDSRGRRKHRKRTGSSGSVGSCGSHSLGFIQYSRGEDGKMTGGMSVTSGLTSNGTVDITQYYVGGRGGNGDHKPPLFPVITTTTTTATSNLKDAMGGDGGDGVDELVSPLSDNEYCDDDYDDTPEQEEHEVLNVDDAEEELAVYEDEEEEDVSALKGVTLFDSMTSIHGLDEEVIAAEVAPLPSPPFSTTDMPKLQPPKGENENRQSVRDMIGRYEANVGAEEEEEEEAESWSPSMIRRKNDQLFSSPEQQPQERKQYQFYPEWQKESVESRPAAVFTTTTTAAAATTEVTPAAAAATEATPPAAAAAAIEIPTQRSRKPRKKRFINGTGSGNKSSSLEHQIRLVLGNSSNDDDSKDKGPVDKASASDILRELNSSHDHDDSRDEGQSNDNASASDILRELNSSKEQQHQQQKPLRSSPNSGNRLPPPSSISFGSRNKQHQKQRISKQSSVATNNGVNTSKKTPALLAPSRRDLHSLRIRQMVSKSTMMTNDKVVDDGGAQIKKATPAPSIATTSTATTNTNTTTTRESSVRPIRGGKGFFTRTGPSSSGLYFSDMITRDETANNNNNNFDLYHPGRPSNTTVQTETAPQEAYALSSPPRDVTPEKPGSPTNSLAESINELKASISELKSAGVGGVGKSTSTLVWNESTGRYVIRDVDDESFDDMVSKGSKGPTVMQESDDDEEEEEDPTLMFNTSNHITRGSILDDDVVDKAVRLAAVENMSSASTSVGAASADESLNHFLSSPGEEEEEDDFFVVDRSNQNAADGDNGWSAFQQSSENDEFQLNSWGDNGDDGFGDDFGDDASFPSEIQWGANDWTDWEVDDAASKQFGKMNNFVSPASAVPSSNRHDPFNPFAQLVLSLD